MNVFVLVMQMPVAQHHVLAHGCDNGVAGGVILDIEAAQLHELLAMGVTYSLVNGGIHVVARLCGPVHGRSSQMLVFRSAQDHADATGEADTEKSRAASWPEGATTRGKVSQRPFGQPSP
ncbi:hypothetical protein D3C72_2109500 [compost metagenome]